MCIGFHLLYQDAITALLALIFCTVANPQPKEAQPTTV
jgi:hypothetical protein